MLYVLFGTMWLVVTLVIVYQKALAKKGLSTLRKFDSPFHNKIYQLSFLAPFKWFVEDDQELTPKGEHMRTLIQMARYDKKFTVRSFMAYHFSLLVGAVLASLVVIYLLQYASTAMAVIFSVDGGGEIKNEGIDKRQALTVFIVFVALALFPKYHLQGIAKKELVRFNKELPMIQMFVILMLKSGKTVRDVLFSLSKLNTYHQETFIQGYRIYMRNPIEGMQYLKNKFPNGRFSEMFSLLEDIGEFARQETITILEGNMRSLTDETNEIKRKNDINRLMYSQFSMAPPFAALILLGILPVIVKGIETFSSQIGAGLGF